MGEHIRAHAFNEPPTQTGVQSRARANQRPPADSPEKTAACCLNVCRTPPSLEARVPPLVRGELSVGNAGQGPASLRRYEDEEEDQSRCIPRKYPYPYEPDPMPSISGSLRWATRPTSGCRRPTASGPDRARMRQTQEGQPTAAIDERRPCRREGRPVPSVQGWWA